MPSAGPGGRADELRVVIVDDQDLFRQGLRRLLEDAGIVVAGEAATGEDAVKLAADELPDVVLMDLHMPGAGGWKAIEQIVARTPSAQVVVLSGSGSEDGVVAAILAGASGYVLKTAPIDQVVASVRSAASGEAVISPAIAEHLLKVVRTSGRALPLASELSERETEVLRLLASGRANPEIADALAISPKTAKNHISSILRKLQLRNRCEAAVYAARRGLV